MSARSISIPLHRLSLALVVALCAPGLALAQSTSTDDQDNATSTATAKARQLDKVTVTGSRIARSQSEGPAPVTVISAADMERQGFTTVQDALTTLTQNTGDTQNESDQTGSTADGQFLNLRGMGPGYTLVLLNGKRMADYPQAYGGTSQAVSLGSIPAAAVERIEILSGGASAIYGSDAVAGVVNVITKTNFSGDTIHVRGGTTTQGGGDTGLLEWSGGKTGDRWSLTYAFEQLNREAVMASQRSIQDSYYDNPKYKDNQANATGQSGVYLYSATSGYLWPSESGALSSSTAALESACSQVNSDFTTFNSSGSGAAANRCGSYNYPAWASIQNGYDKHSAYLYGTFDFTPNTQGYAQVLVNQSKDTSYNKNQYYWSSSTYVDDPSLGLVSASRIVTPDEIGGLVPTTYEENSYNFAFGVRGRIFDRFDWDASANYSRDDITVKRRRFVTDAARDYFLGELQGYDAAGYEIRSVNVDRLFSPISAADYESITTIMTNHGTSENAQGQFSLTGTLFDLPAGPVGLAFVAEAARQSYSLDPDVRSRPDYTGTDSIYNYTATTAGGARNKYAMGLELSIPVFSTLTAHLAGRYDDYVDSSDVGGAFTWQSGLEYRPFKRLLLRATHATTFRAPDLTYLYSGQSSNYAYVVDAYKCRSAGIDPKSAACTGNDSYYYQVYNTYEGNQSLTEETGKSDSLGAVWDITPDMSLSVDYYRIKLYGEVQQIDSTYLMDQEAACRLGSNANGVAVDGNSASCTFYKSLVTRDADGNITAFTSYPINQSMSRTEGLDTSWRYRIRTDNWGVLNLKAGYTKVMKMESQLYPGDEVVDELATDSGYYNFRSRVNWQADWSGGDWNATLYGYRWGSLPNYAETARIAPYIVWNASLSKKITPQATIGLSVTNLFDKMPPTDVSYTAYPFYNHSYSAIGRQVYADFTYNF
ncbi:TonB-dependent receptor [Pseudoxanthomonas sp.]|uniref:TonB-dependent receptor domain-containing protein n=1 Tax=Pseudoxanthomonas sp. TaxID=1871049 RepID=UPI00263367AD|nr:TonB-dependent receptor [Pseudoxanthomonas sp.]WDS35590.1 MAG: TonB-dependent receptor [Pseudoxanthomonas sp.]